MEPEVPPKIKTIEVHPVEAEVIFEAKVVSNTAGVAETVEAAEVADLITTVIGKKLCLIFHFYQPFPKIWSKTINKNKQFHEN